MRHNAHTFWILSKLDPDYWKFNIVPRFWAKVDKTSDPNGCWLWTGSLSKRGYGRLKIRKPKAAMPMAHRISWEIHHGEIPLGQMVLHNCPNGDNTSCVNPDHLFLGDDLINMRDAKSKGRAYTPDKFALARIKTREMHAAVTHCPRGHEYSTENTRVRQLHQKGRTYTVRECWTCYRLGVKHRALLKAFANKSHGNTLYIN